MAKVNYIRNIDQVNQLTAQARHTLKPVCNRFSFRASNYYLSLIDWNDPNDPIRKIIIPHQNELIDFGEFDVSGEETNYVVPGCQHKYPYTALLMCNEICAGYCRFCFRKRLFMYNNDEVVNDPTEALEYIKNNAQITNVLLTGGDPLLMSTNKLEKILRPLSEIEHVSIIRIGTKMTAFNPFRIIDDTGLPPMLSHYSRRDRRIYLMVHFNHPRELTEEAILAIFLIMKAGVIVANQTPILKGINDDPAVLANLMNQLSFIGIAPYYFFQCRPTSGNQPFALSITDAYCVFEKAKKGVSGLAKRARLVMSHETGKMEIIGLTDKYIYIKYHRARDPDNEGQIQSYHRDDDALWLDDLVPADREPRPVKRYGRRPSRAFGPE